MAAVRHGRAGAQAADGGAAADRARARPRPRCAVAHVVDDYCCHPRHCRAQRQHRSHCQAFIGASERARISWRRCPCRHARRTGRPCSCSCRRVTSCGAHRRLAHQRHLPGSPGANCTGDQQRHVGWLCPRPAERHMHRQLAGPLSTGVLHSSQHRMYDGSTSINMLDHGLARLPTGIRWG